jgi:hypothetical protein
MMHVIHIYHADGECKLEDVKPDDMILWMTEAGVETRSPGHIAIVYDTDPDRNIISTGESNGAKDDDGHYGPKLVDRGWTGEVNANGAHYVQFGTSDKVIVVRPPADFG